jgi:UDP-glucose 4-epimerase
VSPNGAVRRALVTGGAGFIGSNLADRLLSDGVEVVVYDNFSTGQRRFIEAVDAAANGTIVEGDVLDGDRLAEAMRGCDIVFHLAANADVRHGLEHPDRDLRQNTIGTFTVLDAMRHTGIRRVVFSSTGSVYGEPEVFPTPEDCPFPRQTSLYAASKLAGEGLIQAFCEGYGFSGVILRFVSIMGERYTHGHLFDFYRKLLDDPMRLEVLGDGRQRKSYLYVADCIDAIMLLVSLHHETGSEVYNLGTDEVTDVDGSIAAVCRHMGVEPELAYAGGVRGWVGDSPLIHLDCSRLRAHGWQPKVATDEAIEQTLSWLDHNTWVFEPRS